MLTILLKIFFLCCYESLHLGGAEDIKDLNPIELIKLGQDISQLHPYKVKPSDVTFYLLTSSDPEPVLITSQNKDLIDASKESKFVIHGWLENHRRSWYKSIGDDYLKNDDINFVEVDWERPARMPYIYSARSVGAIGNEVGRFIKETKLSPKDVHIIGHSLGAHIAGFAGKSVSENTGQKLGRISGLDPAGPYFRQPNIGPNDRLDKEDATIVDAIHTDAGFYGYENPIGTLDIYVNGGQRIQPGCLDYEVLSVSSFGDILEKSFCSHARSTKYFAEWINQGKFKCKFCKPVLGVNFFGDRCVFHHNDKMLGADDIDMNITGICFARTNVEEPYLS